MRKILLLPAVLMIWGWPGILLTAYYGVSAMTAYRGPEHWLPKLLMAVAYPNLWCIAQASK